MPYTPLVSGHHLPLEDNRTNTSIDIATFSFQKIWYVEVEVCVDEVGTLPQQPFKGHRDVDTRVIQQR